MSREDCARHAASCTRVVLFLALTALVTGFVDVLATADVACNDDVCLQAADEEAVGEVRLLQGRVKRLERGHRYDATRAREDTLLGKTPAVAKSGGLDLVFLADIGHPREHRDRFVSPFPMDKSAVEGSFSLYEALYDFVANQGKSPRAVLIMGDVGYTGGDNEGNRDIRVAIQKYLREMVSEAAVFPVIGNHDIHYLGCSLGEGLPLWRQTCNYGTGRMMYYSTMSTWQMTYETWRQNWLEHFPGLESAAIQPPPALGRQRVNLGEDAWQAPMRYNLNLDDNSCIYIIGGLVTGSSVTNWQGDTPGASQAGELRRDLECAFLEDSLVHGRALSKTVFIYMTHDFGAGCAEWRLVRQIDVWLYGHKHNYWQSMQGGATIQQEMRHYPARILIGNGGFDEGHIDVVNFGHLREEHDGQRARIHFDIYDTCISAEPCPNEGMSGHCWQRCTDQPGGFDGGGGPRKALPSKHGYGFVLDAPRWPNASSNALPWQGKGPWRLRLGDAAEAFWLALGSCGQDCPRDTGGSCQYFSCDSSRLALCDTNKRCTCVEGDCMVEGHCVPSGSTAAASGPCDHATGGSCRFMGCDASRHAQCLQGACICGGGQCAINGVCNYQGPAAAVQAASNTSVAVTAAIQAASNVSAADMGTAERGTSARGEATAGKQQCLIATATARAAALFYLYDVTAEGASSYTARLAVDDAVRGPVVLRQDLLLREPTGFWHVTSSGDSLMPARGFTFRFQRAAGGRLLAASLGWLASKGAGTLERRLGLQSAGSLPVELVALEGGR